MLSSNLSLSSPPNKLCYLPGIDGTVVVLEGATGFTSRGINSLGHASNARLDGDPAKVLEAKTGAGGHVGSHVRLHQAGVEDEAGEPGLLEVETADEPVEGRFTATSKVSNYFFIGI